MTALSVITATTVVMNLLIGNSLRFRAATCRPSLFTSRSRIDDQLQLIEIQQVAGRHRVQGRHPMQTSDALRAAAQLGPDAQAAVVELNKQAGLSHGKVTRCLKSLFGIPLSRSWGLMPRPPSSTN
jgi:hypothetical protein